MPLSLYIHIPFCEVKCGYCDFYSVPRGYGDFGLQEEYVAELIREIEDRAPAHAGRPVASLFFGGGTPSLLEPGLIERVLEALRRFFPWDPIRLAPAKPDASAQNRGENPDSPPRYPPIGVTSPRLGGEKLPSENIEITLETNPKTVSLGKLKDFRSQGVNRLSIGVQSFKDRLLKTLGRIHNGSEARKTIEEARTAGLENLGIDLIYAIPGQTFEDWREDLEEAVALGIPHLSAYHLTIEEGTPFAKALPDLPTEEEGVRMLTWTRERVAEAGFEPYEISNFSRPGFESVHNRNYWHYGEYLGFGAAATSFVKGATSSFFAVRRTNVRDLKKYVAGEWEGFSEEIGLPTAMGEFCMLALRTREGIREREFQREFGISPARHYTSQLSRWMERGWMERYAAGWRLTPAGILFADEIAASFLP